VAVRLARALVAALPAAAGCAAPGTEAAGRAYYSARPEAAERLLLDRLERDADARALCLDELGVLALDRRDLELAGRRFLEADRIMNAFAATDAKEVGAIVGAESSKIWRGEPYEKSMNSYYLGIVNLLRGVDDNALAGFKNSIFLDSSREESFECDFAPAWFLEAFALERLGDLAAAERSRARARALAPDCPAVAPGNRGNLVVVVDVGRGPSKAPAGRHGEALRYFDHPGLPASIEVFVDGERAGSTAPAGDIWFQATTRGGRVFDRVLRGKAIYKSGAQAAGIGALLIADDFPEKYQAATFLGGLALLLSSWTVRAEADTRHWTTLPARVQLFRGSVAPGARSIEVVPSSGRVAGPRLQTITVPDRGLGFAYQRVLD
jgi:tetratricopeptide (TPR) repeat protein